MNRRDLIKAIPALAPVELAGHSLPSVEIKPGRKYLVFIDPLCVDVESLAFNANNSGVDMDVLFVPVMPPPGGTIDDAVRVYEIGEEMK